MCKLGFSRRKKGIIGNVESYKSQGEISFNKPNKTITLTYTTMKTFSLACLLIAGAQAINVNSMGKQEAPESMGEPAAEAEEDILLTTYIGFEFEGTEIAEKFTALTVEQQNELRLLVEETILDYWTSVGEPMTEEEPMMEDETMEEDLDADAGNTLAQVDADADCEADAEWGCGYGGYGRRYGGCGLRRGYGCGYGGCGCCCKTYCQVIPGCCRKFRTSIVHHDIHDVHHIHNKVVRHNLHVRKFRVPGIKTCKVCRPGCGCC